MAEPISCERQSTPCTHSLGSYRLVQASIVVAVLMSPTLSLTAALEQNLKTCVQSLATVTMVLLDPKTLFAILSVNGKATSSACVSLSRYHRPISISFFGINTHVSIVADCGPVPQVLPPNATATCSGDTRFGGDTCFATCDESELGGRPVPYVCGTDEQWRRADNQPADTPMCFST